MQEADLGRCERRTRRRADRSSTTAATLSGPPSKPDELIQASLARLIGTELPPTSLIATSGGEARLNEIVLGWGVYYLYPGIEQERHLDAAQHRAFTREHAAFVARNTRLVGISSELPLAQMSRIRTFQMRYPLLSDPECELLDALDTLPSAAQTARAYPRLTLIAHEGVLRHFFYPIADPTTNPSQALAWLQLHA